MQHGHQVSVQQVCSIYCFHEDPWAAPQVGFLSRLWLENSSDIQVTDILARLSVCEKASIDECYLDITKEARRRLDACQGQLPLPPSPDQIHICGQVQAHAWLLPSDSSYRFKSDWQSIFQDASSLNGWNILCSLRKGLCFLWRSFMCPALERFVCASHLDSMHLFSKYSTLET